MHTRYAHILPAIAAVFGLALAGPALGQSGQGGASGSNPGAGQPQASSQPQASQGASRSAAGQATGQQQLRQQLTQAGFRDVQVVDTAYLVQARTSEGNTVIMMVNPPGSGMQTSSPSGAPTGGSGSSGPMGSSSGSGQGSGQSR
jgi:hypothetical protein